MQLVQEIDLGSAFININSNTETLGAFQNCPRITRRFPAFPALSFVTDRKSLPFLYVDQYQTSISTILCYALFLPNNGFRCNQFCMVNITTDFVNIKKIFFCPSFGTDRCVSCRPYLTHSYIWPLVCLPFQFVEQIQINTRAIAMFNILYAFMKYFYFRIWIDCVKNANFLWILVGMKQYPLIQNLPSNFPTKIQELKLIFVKP